MNNVRQPANQGVETLRLDSDIITFARPKLSSIVLIEALSSKAQTQGPRIARSDCTAAAASVAYQTRSTIDLTFGARGFVCR